MSDLPTRSQLKEALAWWLPAEQVEHEEAIAVLQRTASAVLSAPTGRLIQSEWKYRNRIWTVVMDSDVDASLTKRFALVPVEAVSDD